MKEIVEIGGVHKVITYVEYRAVSGVFQNIDPPPPLHPASVSSPRTREERQGKSNRRTKMRRKKEEPEKQEKKGEGDKKGEDKEGDRGKMRMRKHE